jgi:hypothetical protein
MHVRQSALCDWRDPEKETKNTSLYSSVSVWLLLSHSYAPVVISPQESWARVFLA